jgi:predicted nucleic acid-binding protein
MIVLDSCIWIHAFLGTDEKCVSLIEKVLSGDLKPVVSPYIAIEVTDNVLREGNRKKYDMDKLQTAIWSIFREPFVKTTFTPLDFEMMVLEEVRSRPEYCALATALSIEPKDAPIVVLAYEYAIPLATMDERSLLSMKEKVNQLIEVDIISVDEALSIY